MLLGLFPSDGKAIGFFDGVAKGIVGGGGVLLKINKDLIFQLKLGCCKAANTKSELLSLWCLLEFAWTNGIIALQGCRDSLFIVK